MIRLSGPMTFPGACDGLFHLRLIVEELSSRASDEVFYCRSSLKVLLTRVTDTVFFVKANNEKKIYILVKVSCISRDGEGRNIPVRLISE